MAINGPFSDDFQWVYLDDWPHGPIRLTEAQARLFAALWKHRNQSQPAEFFMRAAGLSSEKPMDVFKIKAANRGDPLYLGPLQAYEQLVSRQRRLGLYQLAWDQKSCLRGAHLTGNLTSNIGNAVSSHDRAIFQFMRAATGSGTAAYWMWLLNAGLKSLSSCACSPTSAEVATSFHCLTAEATSSRVDSAWGCDNSKRAA